MKYKITAPQQATGSICLPASKSISNRALIIHALTDSPLPVQNVSDSDDTNAMLRALTFQSPLIDVGAAGTSMRFLTALLSAKKGEWTITGSERMKNRPIKLLVDALNSLGADICYIEKEGFPPLKIKGAELEGGEIELDGGVSSQYISALLMIAPLMKKGLSLTLKGRIISEPYIHLTLTMMNQFGIRYSRKENTIHILPQVYKPAPFTVESDWSGASYWFEILSLLASGEFVLEGLHQNSAQGDARVATIFSQLGIETIYRDNAISIKKKEPLVRSIEYDFVNEPDLAQTAAVACCLLDIPFTFSGLESLHIKETDRVKALITELKKLGFLLKEVSHGVLEYAGKRCETSADVEIATYEDHRMAMAFAPAAIKTGSIVIQDPSVVTKSYPDFWKDLEKAGFVIEALI